MKTITTPRYGQAFWNMMKKRSYDATDLNARNQSPEGYYLPSESCDKFWKQQERMNLFRKLATVKFTESSESKVKSVLPTGAAAFVEEGGVIPEADAGYTTWMVNGYKIAKIAKVSCELVSDAGFDLEGALAAEFGREFGKVEEDGCINGTGENSPYGLLHSTEGAETGVTIAEGGTIGFDDVRSLFFLLKSEYRRNASWLMSDETALYLRTLKDSAGNYLWRNSDDTILGKPVYTSPYMPEIFSGNKPIVFSDISFYWLIDRGGLTLKALNEKYALNGVTGFIGTEFVDGRLVQSEAVKVLVMA